MRRVPLTRSTHLRTRTPISHLSTRRRQELAAYRLLRAAFLFHNPNCARCGKPACDVHHMAGRRGLALLDVTRWLALCRECHRRITTHPAEALAQGWSLPRTHSAN